MCRPLILLCPVVLLALVGACDDTLPAAERYAQMDSVDRRAVDQYVRVYRAQLTARDPKRAFVATFCESIRLGEVVGQDRADRINRLAYDLAFTPADRPALARLDQQLRAQMYGADDTTCINLAWDGMLGDTSWPVRKRKFDAGAGSRETADGELKASLLTRRHRWLDEPKSASDSAAQRVRDSYARSVVELYWATDTASITRMFCVQAKIIADYGVTKGGQIMDSGHLIADPQVPDSVILRKSRQMAGRVYWAPTQCDSLKQ